MNLKEFSNAIWYELHINRLVINILSHYILYIVVLYRLIISFLKSELI